MTVGGWYDAEDLFGPLEVHRATERLNPGITNLLVGEVPFTETIHADRLSDAHIIPQGDADPVDVRNPHQLRESLVTVSDTGFRLAQGLAQGLSPVRGSPTPPAGTRTRPAAPGTAAPCAPPWSAGFRR